MRIAHMKHLKIKAALLSPVHVGTGEEIAPLEYTVKNDKLYRFDFFKFVSILDVKKRAELLEISKKHSIRTIMDTRTFIKNNFDPNSMQSAILEEIDISDSSFNIKFDEVLNSLANSDPSNVQINQLSVMELYRSGGKTVIPGSSIKGSIRTAILDNLLGAVQDKKNKEEELKKFKGKNDPFNALKVSDFIRNKEDQISIGYFLNYPYDNFSKDIGNSSLSVACEVLKEGLAYRGDINIIVNEDIMRVTHEYFSALRQVIIDENKLFKIINEHYFPLFMDEYELFKNHIPSSDFVKRIEKNNYIEELKENKIAIIRVGRHSGSEAVTIQGRTIKVKKKDDYQFLPKPTTKWYFSQRIPKDNSFNNQKLFPCGWIIIKVEE